MHEMRLPPEILWRSPELAHWRLLGCLALPLLTTYRDPPGFLVLTFVGYLEDPSLATDMHDKGLSPAGVPWGHPKLAHSILLGSLALPLFQILVGVLQGS